MTRSFLLLKNMWFKKSVLSFVVSIICGWSFGQQVVPALQLSTQQKFVQSKNFGLLDLLQQTAEVRKLVETDPLLSKFAASKNDSLQQALLGCKNRICFGEKIKFTDAEIASIGNELLKLYKSNGALTALVKNQLIPSGAYGLYLDITPENLLTKAWEQDAKAINRTIDIYALGKKPNYPAIDSISFNVADKQYPALLYDLSASVLEDAKTSKLFFFPAITFALRCLEINGREQAGDYEPMISTVNKAAVDRIKTINWNKYKYTLILVPGAGPEKPGEALSAEGMLRCRIAVHHYLEGMAPFIMVSGGKVHPFKTNYCEAEEMKSYLMKTFHIPESAILTEPHARHTTTNMRNCARLIYRYKIPADKPFLTSTTKAQSFAITNMAARCKRELHYVPYKVGKRLSDTDQEFYAVKEALQINADEPLDP